MSSPIAIVGVSAVFPGPMADPTSLEEYWQLVCRGESLIAPVPSVRWRVEPQFCADPQRPQADEVACASAALLGMLPEIWGAAEESRPWLSQADRSVRMAVHAGTRAWSAIKANPPDRSRCGLILAHIALPTDALGEATTKYAGGTSSVSGEVSHSYPRPEQPMAGPARALSEVLELNGVCRTIDAACASALFAIEAAVDELQSGRQDVILTGGLCAPDNLYVHMGFTQLHALSHSGRCLPLTGQADGLVPGEGAALFVLKRLEDALRDGDEIWGLIESVATGNDRSGPILLPAQEGQLRTMRAAYTRADLDPSDVQLIHCHATGTPVGDRIELESLDSLFRDARANTRPYLRAAKANSGHWLTGATGLALLEGLISMRSGMIAPQPGFMLGEVESSLGSTGFRIANQAISWPAHHGPRRFAVSGFGFGGTNGHLIVREYSASLDAVTRQPAVKRAVRPEPLQILGLLANRKQTHSNGVGESQHAAITLQGLRSSPRELKRATSQHLVGIEAAQELLAQIAAPKSVLNGLRGGVFVGLDLDEGAAAYHLRWTGADKTVAALDADATLGALGSVLPSRLARMLAIGGPAIAVSHHEAQLQVAWDSANAAIAADRIDWALVLAVCTPGPLALKTGRFDAANVVGVLVMSSQVAAPCGLRSRFDESTQQAYRQILASPMPLAQNVDQLRRVALSSEATQTRQNSVVCLLSAASLSELEAQISQCAATCARDEVWQTLPDPQHAFRAAVCADSRVSAGVVLSALQSDASNEVLTARSGASIAWANTRAQIIDRQVAIVSPGSGAWSRDIGRKLLAAAPELHDELADGGLSYEEAFGVAKTWSSSELEKPAIGLDDGLDWWMPAQVAFGWLMTHRLRSWGIEPASFIGLSLGETTNLVASRVWKSPREIFLELRRSPLFQTELAGRCDLFQRRYDLHGNGSRFAASLILLAASKVESEILPDDRLFVMIASTDDSCVVGGVPADLAALLTRLRAPAIAVRGASTVHAPIFDDQVIAPYLRLHRWPRADDVSPRIYSCAYQSEYELDEESIARALLAQATQRVEFPATIRRAHRDGANLFVDVGPGTSTQQSVGQILAKLPGVTTLACDRHADDPVRSLAEAVGQLWIAGAHFDAAQLHAALQPPTWAYLRQAPKMAFELPTLRLVNHPAQDREDRSITTARANASSNASGIETYTMTQPTQVGSPRQIDASDFERALLAGQFAHGAFLSLAQVYQGLAAQVASSVVVEPQPINAARVAASDSFAPQQKLEHVSSSSDAVPLFDRNACLELAIGSLAKVLGPAFVEVDTYPTRVRLPDEPLMLVDRIMALEGDAHSLKGGRVVTEHDVLARGWYLDSGRLPTCIAVEAGQADLFLSGYLGIDGITKGNAVYRLLDAVVTFEGQLPQAGEVVRYDIHIDHFFELGGSWYFRFYFDAFVGERRLMTMRDGCAGFFDERALAAGKGVVGDPPALRHAKQAAQPAVAWTQVGTRTLDAEQLDALRIGDLVECFGAEFIGLPRHRPLTIPGGRMRLVHRIVELDRAGGAWGLGKVVGEADVEPDAWFLTCHFVDDQVMPGTLMYECCLHTLRVLLLQSGYVGEEQQMHWGPVSGVASRLKCRGQVLATTKVVRYEIQITQLDFAPQPQIIAFARMYADDKLIVEIENMSTQLIGSSREDLDSLWHSKQQPSDTRLGLLPGIGVGRRENILAFARGSLVEAFGEPYRAFDEARKIARLPRPPFQLVDRVVAVSGDPFVMRAGASCRTQFDLRPDHWFFSAASETEVPFAVLLEIALQPCGWLAAYVGSALRSEQDLCFRNLGGKAKQLKPVARGFATLTVDATLTDVSQSAGMIVQSYDMVVRTANANEVVYEGQTTFGFFSQAALAQQIGVRGAKWFDAGATQSAVSLPTGGIWPDARWQMIDVLDTIQQTEGPCGLGYVSGSIAVDPQAWFFRAHFKDDPVWPGSLGLEAFLQLIRAFVASVTGSGGGRRALDLESGHEWMYRGQIVPTRERVRVEAWPTSGEVTGRSIWSGQLAVDGKIIYRMDNFAWEARA